MLSPVDADRFVDVIAKVVQECQNGLIGRVMLLANHAPSIPDALPSDIVADAQRYAVGIGAEICMRTAGLDLMVPQAVVTVEMTPAGVVVAGHRRREAAVGSGGGFRPPPDPTAAPGRARFVSADLWTLAADVATADLAGEDDSARAAVAGLLEHDSRLVATLAADALNEAGVPAVPRFVVEHGHAGSGAGNGLDDRRFTEVWESRISVDEYALFEATHPAYAAQMLVVGRMIRRHLSADPPRMLDVGSGPGLPTVMLAELFPHSLVDAVEPSPIAFRHLSRNVAGYRVTPHNVGVADFKSSEGYPVVVSVGTSHHLDTRVFLRSLARLAARDGLVVVADEMVSRFRSEEERLRTIIEHHMAYIDAALAHVPADALPAAERRRLAAFRSAERTPEGLHRLLVRVREDRVPHDGDGPWQRVRFAVLELEALVAGLDYDVERKTYPENFVEMARIEGLELVGHRRVYGTVGCSPFDAGTHVFAFRAHDGR